MDDLSQRVARVTGASSAARGERVARVWGGYGEVWRYGLTGAEWPSVVVKHVKPGKGTGRGHDRKIRSYEVEQTWYREWAACCGTDCRVPWCVHAERDRGEWLFVLEDLDAAGFPGRRDFLSRDQLAACMRWLARFHATFLGERPRGLWKAGTYWHLKTRPDEHRAMAPGPLRDHAATIDRRLREARFQTFVHGDAKPANFCFSTDGGRVAAVDFQYVGGGPGIIDVAYLLATEDEATVQRGQAVYFKALRKALKGRDGGAVVAEWRDLYPWAWADFHRFLAGWAPDWRFQRHEEVMTRQVLAACR